MTNPTRKPDEPYGRYRVAIVTEADSLSGPPGLAVVIPPISADWSSFLSDEQRLFALLVAPDTKAHVEASLRAAALEHGVDLDIDAFASGPTPELERSALCGPGVAPRISALLVLDRPMNEDQLSGLDHTLLIEVDPVELSAGASPRQRLIREAANAAEAALQRGLSPVVYPASSTGDPASTGAGFAGIIAGIERRPGFAVVSPRFARHVIADGLGGHRATVLGSAGATAAAWRLDTHSRYPLLPVIISGTSDFGELAELVRRYRGY